MLTPEIIKKAREDAGLTTAEAAELIGVTQRCWQFWEAEDKGRKMKKPFWDLFLIKVKEKSNAL